MERYYSTFLPMGPAGGRWRWLGRITWHRSRGGTRERLSSCPCGRRTGSNRHELVPRGFWHENLRGGAQYQI